MAPAHNVRRTSPTPGGRVFWIVLATCWITLVAAAWHLHLRARGPRHAPADLHGPLGTYARVSAVEAPFLITLDGERAVRPAGLAAPESDAEGETLLKRIRALIESAAPDVYVARGAPGDVPDGGRDALVWFPPPEAEPGAWYPAADMQLLSAVLVQEGLARVDPERPCIHQQELEMLQDDARRHGRGIWATGGPNP